MKHIVIIRGTETKESHRYNPGDVCTVIPYEVMSDSFETNGIIILQPGSATVPYSFTFAAASSATANDGSIPYGSTISKADVKAFDAFDNDVTSQMIVSETNTTLSVTVSLKYPATSGPGNYSLEFLLTLSTGAVIEVDFTRIFAGDIAA